MKKYCRNSIGYKLTTNEGYELLVVDGSNRKGYCTVLLDGVKFEVQSSQLKSKGVKNKLHRSVYGVAFFGHGKHKARCKTGKNTKVYETWIGMIERCYSSRCHVKNPAYKNCTVCDDWLNFQNFADWFYDNYIDGFELDKDIKI